jgi:hypothetical protein
MCRMGHRTISASGSNPGNPGLPLHVRHDIHLFAGTHAPPFRYLRLFVLNGYTDWGVSLWQLDVHGERGAIYR